MRILLIARHYPPAVSGGSKRPFLLAQALRKAGADVRVAAPSLPEREPGWAVHHPHRDPITVAVTPRYDRIELINDLTLWPDPDIIWSKRLEQVVLDSGWQPDWVISTSPPESVHVSGQRLARKLGARWAADFRDLWLQSPHRRERRRPHRRIGEYLLARLLLWKANLVIAVDPVVAAEASRLGARNVHVVRHFVFDEPPPPAELPHETINIVHAGSISLSDPEALISDLLRPFEAARARNPAIVLHLVGRLSDAEVGAVNASAATDAIRLRGSMPLPEALGMMAAADALIYVASHKMHVPPSKIADYLMFSAPIIGCGDGPWRNDPRVDRTDPAQLMSSLKKGARRDVGVCPPTASETAAYLLGLMRQAEAQDD